MVSRRQQSARILRREPSIISLFNRLSIEQKRRILTHPQEDRARIKHMWLDKTDNLDPAKVSL